MNLLPERTIMDPGEDDHLGQPGQAAQAAEAEQLAPGDQGAGQQEAGPGYGSGQGFYQPGGAEQAYQPASQPADEPAYQPDRGQPPYQQDQDQRAYQQNQDQDADRGDHIVGDPFEADSLAGRSFTSIPLIGDMAHTELPRRDPLPLGAEPPADHEPAAAGQGHPVVLGIFCENGHFDDPEASYCAVCGASLAQVTRAPQEGPRPPLGVLVMQDGSVCQLDSDYVLGREPDLDSSVTDGSARPLRLDTASGLVSRIHARIELDGWRVFISDLNSANGTEIMLPGDSSGRPLPPGIRTPLVAGAQVRLGGDYGLRYDSHRQW